MLASIAWAGGELSGGTRSQGAERPRPPRSARGRVGSRAQPRSPWWGDGLKRPSWRSVSSSSGSAKKCNERPEPFHRGRGGDNAPLKRANLRRADQKQRAVLEFRLVGTGEAEADPTNASKGDVIIGVLGFCHRPQFCGRRPTTAATDRRSAPVRVAATVGNNWMVRKRERSGPTVPPSSRGRPDQLRRGPTFDGPVTDEGLEKGAASSARPAGLDGGDRRISIVGRPASNVGHRHPLRCGDCDQSKATALPGHHGDRFFGAAYGFWEVPLEDRPLAKSPQHVRGMDQRYGAGCFDLESEQEQGLGKEGAHVETAHGGKTFVAAT